MNGELSALPMGIDLRRINTFLTLVQIGWKSRNDIKGYWTIEARISQSRN